MRQGCSVSRIVFELFVLVQCQIHTKIVKHVSSLVGLVMDSGWPKPWRAGTKIYSTWIMKMVL